jgi:hypothetical protein
MNRFLVGMIFIHALSTFVRSDLPSFALSKCPYTIDLLRAPLIINPLEGLLI